MMKTVQWEKMHFEMPMMENTHWLKIHLEMQMMKISHWLKMHLTMNGASKTNESKPTVNANMSPPPQSQPDDARHCAGFFVVSAALVMRAQAPAVMMMARAPWKGPLCQGAALSSHVSIPRTLKEDPVNIQGYNGQKMG